MKLGSLSLKEINDILCPKCQEKLEKLVRPRVAKFLAKQALKGK